MQTQCPQASLFHAKISVHVPWYFCSVFLFSGPIAVPPLQLQLPVDVPVEQIKGQYLAGQLPIHWCQKWLSENYQNGLHKQRLGWNEKCVNMAIWMIFNLECWLASDMLDAYLTRLVPRLHNIYIWVARQTPRIFNLMIGVYLAERRKESREGLESRVTSYWVVVASHVLGARVWNGHTFIDIFLLAHRGHGAHCAHSSLRPEARTCCSSTAANLLDSTRSCNTRMANKKMYQDMYLTSLPSANMYMLFKSLLSRTYSYKICHSRHSNHSKEALKRSLLVEWTASLMQKVKKRLDHLLDSVVPLAIL